MTLGTNIRKRKYVFRLTTFLVAFSIIGFLVRSPIVNVSPVVTSPNDITDFGLQWCRLQRWRVDWEAIASPCWDKMAWEYRDVKSRLRTNAYKSFISKWEIQPAGHFSRFWIQSVNMDGKYKTFGGDSWRVYIRQGPASLAPVVIDHNNGLYEVLVLITEPGSYYAGIYLDYTLCNGYRDPPEKWFINGTNQGLYEDTDEYVLGDISADFINMPLRRKTHFRFEVPTNSGRKGGYFDLCRDNKSCTKLTASCGVSCLLMWDGHGRWVNGSWRSYSPVTLPKPTTSQGSPNHLLILGDSNARRFSELSSGHNLCKNIFKRCNLVQNWVYKLEINRSVIPPGQDFNKNIVLDLFREVLSEPQMNNSQSVLLFNMGIHYSLALNFSQFQSLLSSVIGLLKEKEADRRTLKYKMDIVWRGTSMIEREKLPIMSKGLFRLNSTLFRFHNNQRIQLFHAYSMDAMCKAGYKVLDTYPLTAAYPYGTLDNVHYNLDAFLPAVRTLENYYNTQHMDHS